MGKYFFFFSLLLYSVSKKKRDTLPVLITSRNITRF